MDANTATIDSEPSKHRPTTRYLQAGEFSLFKEGGLYNLTIPGERTYVRVSTLLMHPTKSSDRYISLHDGCSEVGIIRDLNEMDPATQRTIREMVARRYHVPRITKILKTVEFVTGIAWHVETDYGPRRFNTRSATESIWRVADDRYYVADIEGNRYELLGNCAQRKHRLWLQQVV